MLIHAARHYGVSGLGVDSVPEPVRLRHGQGEAAGTGRSYRKSLSDYRQVAGRFDKVVSIGMFEHVGRRFIPGLFRAGWPGA